MQRQQYRLNLEIPTSNQVSFGIKGLRIQWPNSLSRRIKSVENHQTFSLVAIFVLILVFSCFMIIELGLLLFLRIDPFCICKEF